MIVIPFINTVNFVYAKEFWLKSVKVPVISGVIVDNILDVSADIEAVVDAMGADTSVTLEYGLTLSYGSSITFPQSPVLADNSPVTVSVTLNSLLPYKRYFYRIIATNSKGSTIVANNFVTLEPLELTDGNWVAMWDAEYEKNVIVPSGLAELRDKRFDCALGNEIVPDPEFNSPTGWGGLGASIRIEDGKLKFDNAGSGSAAFQMPVEDRVVTIFHIESKGIVYTSGNAFIRPGTLGDCFVNGAIDLSVGDGDYVVDKATVQMNGYLYIRVKAAGTTITFENLSVKRVLGNHAYVDNTSYFPSKSTLNDYFHFDGVNDRLFCRTISSVGTIYALARRNGVDPDFYMLNALSGIGDFSTGILTIGANSLLSNFYDLDIKILNVRSVTDSPETIAKLNEWFSRESHELPELFNGILGTGIWNDAAIHDDVAIPVTI